MSNSTSGRTRPVNFHFKVSTLYTFRVDNLIPAATVTRSPEGSDQMPLILCARALGPMAADAAAPDASPSPKRDRFHSLFICHLITPFRGSCCFQVLRPAAVGGGRGRSGGGGRLRPFAAEFLAAPKPPVWPVGVVVVAELFF